MSTTLDPPPQAEIAQLQPKLSARYALSIKHVLFCLGFGIFFLYLNFVPLWHSDIWGHVNYGKWILTHHALPAQDPFMPLAEGMYGVDTAWLAQLIFASVEQWGGAEALSTLFAAVGLATYLVLCRAYYLASGRLPVALLGTALALALGWTRHAIIRPEIFGQLGFALLIWMVAGSDAWGPRSEAKPGKPAQPASKLSDRWDLWIGVPLLFALWANLHGSFALGLVLLGCVFTGRAIEVVWRQKSAAALLTDTETLRWFLLGQLAFAACLLNPYGMDLMVEIARFSRNQNLQDVQEWLPLKLVNLEGIQLAISWVLLLVVWRHSRRTVRPVEVLLLAAFGIAVAPSIRMIGWYAPVAVLVLVPHFADLVNRYWPARSSGEPENEEKTSPDDTQVAPGHSFAYTLACGLAIWICLALSPSGAHVVGGKARPTGRLYSPETPTKLTEYLREHQKPGLMFAPQWWGDWLCWDGPPGTQVYTTTHIHLVPRRVWQDYMRIVQAQPGWERSTDRYHIDRLAIHKSLQPQLTAAVRRNRDWRVAYEDDLALLMERVQKDEKAGTSDQPEASTDAPAETPSETEPEPSSTEQPESSSEATRATSKDQVSTLSLTANSLSRAGTVTENSTL